MNDQLFKKILFDFTRNIGENANAFFQRIGTRYNLTVIANPDFNGAVS